MLYLFIYLFLQAVILNHTAAPHDNTAEMNSFAYKKNIETYRETIAHVTYTTDVCVIYRLFVELENVGK